MFISLIGSLADDYMQTEVEKLVVSSGQEALKGLVLQEKRNAVWHFVDHVAVKWGVENPFRLEPATEEQQEVINKEENGNQQEEDPNAA